MEHSVDVDEEEAGASAAGEQLVRAYYEAIDADEYERLAGLLDPRFVHQRPDRTIDGRDRFVSFMREERPDTDTTHVVERVYAADESAFAVQGCLLSNSDEALFEYVDVFSLESERIQRLETYVASDG